MAFSGIVFILVGRVGASAVARVPKDTQVRWGAHIRFRSKVGGIGTFGAIKGTTPRHYEAELAQRNEWQRSTFLSDA